MKIPRWIKYVGIGIGALVLILLLLAGAGLYWFTHQPNEWPQTKRELEAKGEKLWLRDLVPPPIPDESNLFYAPLFQDMIASQNAKTFRIDALEIKPVDGEGKIIGTKNARDSRGLMNLDAYAARLRTDENKNLPTAQVILDAFQKSSEVWDELYEAAKRPDARFPLQYEKTTLMPMPHVSKLLMVSQMLHLRAVADMEAGQSKEAQRDILLVFRLADVFKNEPILISQLVRLSLVRIAVNDIWEGIQRRAWSADQLANFENQLAKESVLDGLSLGLRGDRGGSNEAFVNQLPDKVREMLFSEKMDSQKYLWQNVSFLRNSMAYSSVGIQRVLDALSEAQKTGINQKHIPSIKIPSGMLDRWKYTAALLSLPALESAVCRFAETQTKVDMARIACALERYRMAKESYPENLAQLVPDYIQNLPNDMVVS